MWANYRNGFDNMGITKHGTCMANCKTLGYAVSCLSYKKRIISWTYLIMPGLIIAVYEVNSLVNCLKKVFILEAYFWNCYFE